MKKFIKRIIEILFRPVIRKYSNMIDIIETNRILTAQLHIANMKTFNISHQNLYDFEFKVFSQYGEDGIIQYLISKIQIDNKIFVEFGVQNYIESNTRFLLINNNWKGLIMDSDSDFIKKIRSSEIYWRYDITAITAFITRDNINELISSRGIKGDIGLLSIDIDGNDYWVWEAIDVIFPRIVICEYNSVFGCKEAISIPYDKNFYRTKSHYSNLYFGASLKALCRLARRKGYIFLGSNRAGSNAFFVREDVAGDLIAVDCEKGYVKSSVRESRDKNGNLTFFSWDNRLNLIKDMQVINVETEQYKTISQINI